MSKEYEMSVGEANLKLKEEIAVLEKMYADLYKEYDALIHIPSMCHGNLKVQKMVCTEQIKAQNGENNSQKKFETVKEFAEFVIMFNDIMLSYLEEHYGGENI